MNSTLILVTTLSVLLERISTCAVDDVKCSDQAKKVSAEPNSTLHSLSCNKILMKLEDVGQEILGIIDPLNFLSLSFRTVEYLTEEYSVNSGNTSGSPEVPGLPSLSSSTGTREQSETGSGSRPNPDIDTEGTAVQAPVAGSTQTPQVATAPASADLVHSSIQPGSLPSAPNAAIPPKIPLPSAASHTFEESLHKNDEPATAVPKQTPSPPVAAASTSAVLTPSSQSFISEDPLPSAPTTLVPHSSAAPLPSADSATSGQSNNSEESSTITSLDTVSTQTTQKDAAPHSTDLTQSTQSLITEGTSPPDPTTVETKSPKVPLSNPEDLFDSAKPSTVPPSETVPTKISQGEEASPSPKLNKPTQSLDLDGTHPSVSTTGVTQSPKIPLPSAASSTSTSKDPINPAGSSIVTSSAIAQTSSTLKPLPTELTRPTQSLNPVSTLPPKIPLPEAGLATSEGLSNPAQSLTVPNPATTPPSSTLESPSTEATAPLSSHASESPPVKKSSSDQPSLEKLQHSSSATSTSAKT